ncbi:MAG: hypothetical protein B7Z37_29465 [Verrucomicrobia bacterium 12-59-8]|nr:MAG: hypothetical protein B7Z37_29465 [Verrucomicrobia bacterium 12-59-8]
MTTYAKTALQAVKLYYSKAAGNPSAAWKMAAEICVPTLEGREKGCPKGAFLGLCEEGWVVDVPSGNYTKSKLNKNYAVQAVRLLRSNPHLANDVATLWGEVMRGGDDESKRHNQQMDVVVALWNAKLIARRD